MEYWKILTQMKINIDIKEYDGGVSFACHVTPGAKKAAVKGTYGQALFVGLSAPPVDGKANKALIDFLSDIFSVATSNIEITKGLKGRDKVVFITGINRHACTRLFEKL